MSVEGIFDQIFTEYNDVQVYDFLDNTFYQCNCRVVKCFSLLLKQFIKWITLYVFYCFTVRSEISNTNKQEVY